MLTDVMNVENNQVPSLSRVGALRGTAITLGIYFLRFHSACLVEPGEWDPCDVKIIFILIQSSMNNLLTLCWLQFCDPVLLPDLPAHPADMEGKKRRGKVLGQVQGHLGRVL